MPSETLDRDQLNGRLYGAMQKGYLVRDDDDCYWLTERGMVYARTEALAQGFDPDTLREVELVSLAGYGAIVVAECEECHP